MAKETEVVELAPSVAVEAAELAKPPAPVEEALALEPEEMALVALPQRLVHLTWSECPPVNQKKRKYFNGIEKLKTIGLVNKRT